MGSTARRAAGTVAAGVVALAGLALLMSPSQHGELALALLAIVVGVGAVQVLIGLSVVGGTAPLERAVVDRSAWGSGWVLDGARAIGLAVAVWMIFAPDARPLAPAGWVILAASLLAQPVSRRLDARAVPALTPGTYVVRASRPAAPVLPMVRDLAPARVLYAVPSVEPVRDRPVLRAVEPRPLHRIDTRL
ncbi:MAG: hypothetical protein AB7O74_05750 [Candidatus Nanopelagicales bacterium]